MSTLLRLQALASREQAPPPYGYEEFDLRGRRARTRRASVRRGLAASLAVVGVAVLLAITTQRLRPEAAAVADVEAVARPTAAPLPQVVDGSEPALVDLGQFALRSELEDRIAWFDMQLSAGRAYAAPAEQLQEMEATRNRLEQSLQRVSYAHSLMSL